VNEAREWVAGGGVGKLYTHTARAREQQQRVKGGRRGNENERNKKLYNDDVKELYKIFLGLRFKFFYFTKRKGKKKTLCNFYVRIFYVFSFNICNRRE
jgi:hypothetical protein